MSSGRISRTTLVRVSESLTEKPRKRTSSRSVVYQSFPNVNGGLANDADRILASEIESRKNTVSTFGTKDFHQGTTRGFRHCSVIDLFVLFDLCLAADARHLEEQFPDKRDGRLLRYNEQFASC